MTYDSTDVVASVVKAVEPDRSIASSHRAAGMAQDQFAEQGLTEAGKRKVERSDKTDKSRFKHEEGEEGRREKRQHAQQRQPTPDGQEHLIDTVA